MIKIYIYTLSDSTGVRYVGQSKDTKRRWYRHIFDAKQSGKLNKRCSWIKSLLNKNEQPILDVIEVTSLIDHSFKEQKWIQQFSLMGCKLVNDTIGGEGRYGSYPNEATKKRMSDSKKGCIPKNYNQFRLSTIKGAVIQYNLNGEPIREWKSGHYAGVCLNINNIDLVLQGKRISAGGYFWSYKDQPLTDEVILSNRQKCVHLKKKIIIQYTHEGIIIKEWPSVNEVKKTYKHINAVLSGKRKTAGGYLWKYK